jgi:hypothetical protein
LDSRKENLKGETSTIDRRQMKRHAFSATTEVKELATGARSSSRAADLSQRGCYLDSLNPFPVGAKIQVRIMWGGEEVTCAGIVRESHPGLGMGVAFMDMDEGRTALIEKWIQKLGSSESDKISPGSRAENSKSDPTDTRDALALRLIELLQKKGLLNSNDVALLLRDEIA